MRTTLTLDDDVAVKLETLRRKTGARFRDVVNDTLRQGLNTPKHKPINIRDFIPVLDLGKSRITNFDKLHDVLDEVEGSDHP